MFDKVFEGGIVIKGIDGALEFLGGVLLLFITPERLHGFVTLITHKELLEDPHDTIANLLVHAAQGFGGGSRAFAIIYLWLHAAIKLTAVIGILKNQLWAYPFSLITLGLLTLYQFYSIFFVRASLGMVSLTILDVVILGLIWVEYGRIKPKILAARQANQA